MGDQAGSGNGIDSYGFTDDEVRDWALASGYEADSSKVPDGQLPQEWFDAYKAAKQDSH